MLCCASLDLELFCSLLDPAAADCVGFFSELSNGSETKPLWLSVENDFETKPLWLSLEDESLRLIPDSERELVIFEFLHAVNKKQIISNMPVIRNICLARFNL